MKTLFFIWMCWVWYYDIGHRSHSLSIFKLCDSYYPAGKFQNDVEMFPLKLQLESDFVEIKSYYLEFCVTKVYYLHQFQWKIRNVLNMWNGDSWESSFLNTNDDNDSLF